MRKFIFSLITAFIIFTGCDFYIPYTANQIDNLEILNEGYDLEFNSDITNYVLSIPEEINKIAIRDFFPQNEIDDMTAVGSTLNILMTIHDVETLVTGAGEYEITEDLSVITLKTSNIGNSYDHNDNSAYVEYDYSKTYTIIVSRTAPADSGNDQGEDTGDLYEEDNLKTEATVLPADTIQSHTIHNQNDIDYFSIDVVNYLTYTLELSEINGFYPEVSFYHEGDDIPYLSLSPFLDDWSEQIIFTSDIDETIYISIKSKYTADLYGEYNIGYSSVTTPMDVPADLTASDALYSDVIALSWTGTSDALSYDIYRSSDGISFVKIGETTETSYSDTASEQNVLSSSVEYTYQVQGVKNSDAKSSFSNTDTGSLLAIPSITDLSAEIVNGTIRLSWTDLPDETISYSVYASADSLNYDIIGNTNLPAFDLKDASPETEYSFYVIVEKLGIVGDQSNIVTAAIPFTGFRPAAPEASQNELEQIIIQWSLEESATGYKLFRSDSNAGEFTQISTDFDQSTSSYTDTDIITGTYYFYKLQLIKDGLLSDFSYSDSGIANSL